MNKFKNILIKAIIIVSLATIVLPIIVMFIWSFTNNYRWPDILPSNFGLRGWKYVFLNNSRILNSLKNSVFISTMTTIITVLISIPCAKALAFNEFKGKKIVGYIVYSPIIIPAVSIGMGLNIQFIKLGLARTYLGVILVSIVPCIPYAVNMIKDVFLITGRGYIDQAYILGAGRLNTIRFIVLPMIMPGIISAAIMCYIVSFSQYFLVYLIGGGRIITFTMDMFPFIQSADRMMGSVYGVIFLVTTIFLLFIMEAFLKRIYKKELDDYMFI